MNVNIEETKRTALDSSCEVTPNCICEAMAIAADIWIQENWPNHRWLMEESDRSLVNDMTWLKFWSGEDDFGESDRHHEAWGDTLCAVLDSEGDPRLRGFRQQVMETTWKFFREEDNDWIEIKEYFENKEDAFFEVYQTKGYRHLVRSSPSNLSEKDEKQAQEALLKAQANRIALQGRQQTA
jgi:hypothetical protein